jgi:uncharacterized sulfatase
MASGWRLAEWRIRMIDSIGQHLVVLVAVVFVALPGGGATARAATPSGRPNIVWIVIEDTGVQLGCYGDKRAHTPNIDRLAAQGARFTHCFTHAPVCAPARSGLVTGIYPTTLGSHHMRSKLRRAPKLFTQYLREAGYHVAWPGKTDFNFDPPADFADSRKNWLDDPPPQPFFAYINFTVSHESRIRAGAEAHAKNTARLSADQRHDPAKMVVPPYYPDTPEVRKDIAQYYDIVTAADYRVGDVLDKLKAHGLEDDTVVFFFGDHGWGMPRGKRWIYDSGIHVPLIVRWPGRIKPGSVVDELVSFVDFAPTVLTVAGVDVPREMARHGHTFLGDHEPRACIYAARDRMDETFDRIRAVRTKRYKYIRNYYPQLPYAQTIWYMDKMPTMAAWRRLAAEGGLTGPAAAFFAPAKAPEELYDAQADPHEIHNLIDSPKGEHVAELERLRNALDRWVESSGDVGAVDERQLVKRGIVVDVFPKYEKRYAEGERVRFYPPPPP